MQHGYQELKQIMSKSNYDKYPRVKIENPVETVFTDWKTISEKIRKAAFIHEKNRIFITVETYPGVYEREILKALQECLKPALTVNARDLYLDEDEIDRITFPDVTADRTFGFMTRLTINDLLDSEKTCHAAQNIEKTPEGVILLYGCGASEIWESSDLFIYADMARFEIQQRMRRNETSNLGTTDMDLDIARKYKRAYFVDWRIADRIKRKTYGRWDFVLDTNRENAPVMITGDLFRKSLEQTAGRPFRLVPFFDPGPWGGQWIKEVCDLDRDVVNYAWCFDCVPEENSLCFDFKGTMFETPAINLVFFQPRALLGERVFARFGAEFPIRFDFLDTMEGDNLSLQVHPTTEYIREQFGMFYTQDESYYLLDAGYDAKVYLGLKENTDPDKMINDLKDARGGGHPFNTDDYVASWTARKHDHFMIPAGTVHCSAANCMVLEISATPYIFTFKLWDWGRMGLDGLPRPINIEHGEKVIQWDRRESWVKKELINQVTLLSDGEGNREERTGMHEFEFIETIRNWFSKKVSHDCHGSVNVLNLVEGREAIIESPDGSFEPFVVHYAETFVIPAMAGKYTIRPHGEAEGKTCATIKAFIRK